MISSLFLRKFVAFFIAIMLVVPGFYNAIQTQKAMASHPCYTVSGPCSSWISQLAQLAKEIITSIQTTITAVKTTYLALKEAVLDPIARLVSGLLSNSLVQMMFSFLGTGNNGAPAFVTNPQRFFGSVANESTNVFLTDLQNNRPQMLPSIRNAVRQRIIEDNYVSTQRMRRSTFPGGDAGYQAYLDDPGTCITGNSWDCYFASLESQNDPWQIYQFESAQLAAKRKVDVGIAEDEFLAASGYHSLKECVEKDVSERLDIKFTHGNPFEPGHPDFIGPMPQPQPPTPSSGGNCFGGPCNTDAEQARRLECISKSNAATAFCNMNGRPNPKGGLPIVDRGCLDNANRDREACLNNSGGGGGGTQTSVVPGSSALRGGGPRGGNCVEYMTKTPGDTIARQTNEYLSNALKLLQAADEIDEVMTQGIGGVMRWMNGKGLTSIRNEVGTRGIDQGGGVTTFPLKGPGFAPSVQTHP